jgi:hypothetical protein
MKVLKVYGKSYLTTSAWSFYKYWKIVCIKSTHLKLSNMFLDGLVGGWVDEWIDRWMDVKTVLKIAFSNQKNR